MTTRGSSAGAWSWPTSTTTAGPTCSRRTATSIPSVPDRRYDQPPLFLRNRGRGQFEDVTAAWGPDLDALRSGRGVAAGDLDGDGDLDLVMTTIDGPLRVLINEGRPAGHSVAVRLVGSPPNREALGASVELRAGGRTQVGVVRRGGSILAASDSCAPFRPRLGRVDRLPEGRLAGRDFVELSRSPGSRWIRP